MIHTYKAANQLQERKSPSPYNQLPNAAIGNQAALRSQVIQKVTIENDELEPLVPVTNETDEAVINQVAETQKQKLANDAWAKISQELRSMQISTYGRKKLFFSDFLALTESFPSYNDAAIKLEALYQVRKQTPHKHFKRPAFTPEIIKEVPVVPGQHRRHIIMSSVMKQAVERSYDNLIAEMNIQERSDEILSAIQAYIQQIGSILSTVNNPLGAAFANYQYSEEVPIQSSLWIACNELLTVMHNKKENLIADEGTDNVAIGFLAHNIEKNMQNLTPTSCVDALCNNPNFWFNQAQGLEVDKQRDIMTFWCYYFFSCCQEVWNWLMTCYNQLDATSEDLVDMYWHNRELSEELELITENENEYIEQIIVAANTLPQSEIQNYLEDYLESTSYTQLGIDLDENQKSCLMLLYNEIAGTMGTRMKHEQVSYLLSDNKEEIYERMLEADDQMVNVLLDIKNHFEIPNPTVLIDASLFKEINEDDNNTFNEKLQEIQDFEGNAASESEHGLTILIPLLSLFFRNKELSIDELCAISENNSTIREIITDDSQEQKEDLIAFQEQARTNQTTEDDLSFHQINYILREQHALTLPEMYKRMSENCDMVKSLDQLFDIEDNLKETLSKIQTDYETLLGDIEDALTDITSEINHDGTNESIPLIVYACARILSIRQELYCKHNIEPQKPYKELIEEIETYGENCPCTESTMIGGAYFILPPKDQLDAFPIDEISDDPYERFQVLCTHFPKIRESFGEMCYEFMLNAYDNAATDVMTNVSNPQLMRMHLGFHQEFCNVETMEQLLEVASGFLTA